MTSMGYLKFPKEYHPSDEIISRLEKKGYIDVSWRNDTATCWAFFGDRDPKAEHPIARIWVEAEDQDLRTDKSVNRFCAQMLAENGLDEITGFWSDDLNEVISFIERHAATASHTLEEEESLQP